MIPRGTIPEHIYNSITALGFQLCLSFSWTTLRGKHCQHPIVVIGVVDTFRQRMVLNKNSTCVWTQETLLGAWFAHVSQWHLRALDCCTQLLMFCNLFYDLLLASFQNTALPPFHKKCQVFGNPYRRPSLESLSNRYVYHR